MNRKSYHHGNLRNELLDLAIVELERVGREALSLRDLAAQLGVARSAPYRHFASRDELLQAIGFYTVDIIRKGFLDALETDAAPREKLNLALRWYINFAVQRSQLYRLVFDNEVPWRIDILKEAMPGSSFGLFSMLISDASDVCEPKKLHDISVAAWSIIHGYVMLRMNSVINKDRFIEDAEEAVLKISTCIDIVLIDTAR